MRPLFLAAAAAVCLLSPVRAADPDLSPLPLEPVLAFPDLEFTGWDFEQNGRISPIRPILLTGAGDGTNRLFVPTQQGTIHVFENKPDVKATKVFIDLTSRVTYKDNENEEGLLGLAFHPKFKDNGYFYVFFTSKEAPHLSVLSRFTANADRTAAEVDSEVEILRSPQPYWNHNGGTLCFGPDGYLYIAFGDGGAGNDPHNNAQNLQNWLGKILRIDVDRQDGNRPYAIPSDNPFIGRLANKSLLAQPEIWAYGLRNIWRMSFDRQTGALWAADVGQNLWEEIDIITKGGNYGWNLREGLHAFAPNGEGEHPTLMDPIWEYHHDIGKSITGGSVYRGKTLPELVGHYVYADYVTGLIWALKYDAKAHKVVANRSIATSEKFAIISFGEDDAGEIYFMIVSPKNNGIYKFQPTGK